MVAYFIAIDGGGTKTDVALFDDNGRIYSRVVGESTNPNALNDEQLKQRFGSIFSRLFSKGTVPGVLLCFAGMAGGDHHLLSGRLKTIISETLPIPCETVQVENDAVNALWSGTEGSAGAVIIAGTGSIAYGRFENGRSFRLGGWGHLVGDEGSGYFIGKEAVRAALRAHDGLQEWSPLFDQIQEHFQVNRVPDVIPIVYGDPKPTLAALVPVVGKAASQGDAVAIGILDRSAEYLGELIEASLSKFSGKEVPIVLAGGLWKVDAIYRRVTERFERPFILPKVPPLYGSMIGALMNIENKGIPNLLKHALKE